MRIVRSIEASKKLLCPFLPSIVDYNAIGILEKATSTVRKCQTYKCMGWVPDAEDTRTGYGSCALTFLDDSPFYIRTKNK